MYFIITGEPNLLRQHFSLSILHPRTFAHPRTSACPRTSANPLPLQAYELQ